MLNPEPARTAFSVMEFNFLERIMNLKFITAGLAAFFLVACEAKEPPATEPESMTQTTDPLTGTSWWVEDIDGGGVIDRSKATVEFVEPGRVAGNSSCNRYMGGYEREGEALTFGNLAGTMMACPEPLMAQEQRFHQAMGQVSGWRIDPATDLLHLLNDAGGSVIRASRMATEDTAED